MDTATPQQGEGSRGSNLSYFLFLSMLFFFMSSSPDTTSEMQYRAALTRLTRERTEFKEWLYPGSTLSGNGTDREGASTTRKDDVDTSTSTSIIVLPSDGVGGGDNHTTTPEPGAEEPPVAPKPFVLEDWTPPTTIRAQVDDLLRQHDRVHEPLYYHNISGFFKGTYTTRPGVNVTDGSQNATELAARQGRFPWTGKSAKKGKSARVVRLNVRETVPHVKGQDAREEREKAEGVIIRGSMELELHAMINNVTGEAEEETQTTQLDMEGVHWLHNGTFFIHAAAPWHDLDMRQLPGLLLTNQTANATAQIVLKELDARIERIRTALLTGRYGDNTGSDGDSRLNCTFSMYGHMKSLPSNIPEARLREWERELRSPTGVSTLTLPPPTLNGILFSKDCNIVVELDEMVGLELEDFWNKAVSYSFILGILTLLQTWVLVKQMEYTTTPSAIGRVSHMTIAIQVMLDVYFCVTHLTLGVVTGNKASKAFLVPGFFGILSGLLFGLRYAAIIRVSTYRPEPAPTPAPAPPQAPAAGAPATTGTGLTASAMAAEARASTDTPNPNTSTPLLVRPQAAATETVGETENKWQAALIVLGALTAVFLFYFVGWFALLVFGTYSYWLPQIYHNAERGSGRNALLKKYIVVTACTRLFIPLYVWACPVNLLFTETSPWVFTLVLWQAVQVLALFLQDILGSRFFLPKGFWFPELDRWDYHPLLPPQDIEAGVVSGAENRDGADGDKKGEVDCVICFEKIELARPGGERASLDVKTGKNAGEPSSMGEVFGAARREANRMTYMVPPCHHIAHTSCLESWAAIKMECPLCRRPLPPF